METVATSKGQVVIPSKIRKQLGIKDGTYLQIDVDVVTRQIILTPVTREYVRSLRGKYKGKGYGSILKAAFIGRVSPHFHRIYGHARPGASQALNKKFGARFLHTHRNWFQTGEDYKSYVLDLEGATD